MKVINASINTDLYMIWDFMSAAEDAEVPFYLDDKYGATPSERLQPAIDNEFNGIYFEHTAQARGYFYESNLICGWANGKGDIFYFINDDNCKSKMLASYKNFLTNCGLIGVRYCKDFLG